MTALAKQDDANGTHDTAQAWTDVGEMTSLFAQSACHGVAIDGRRIGLFCVEGRVHAIDDICTHGNALLSEGELDGHAIECPLHAGLVDVRDGRALCSPMTRDTVVHDVRLADGRVWIHIGVAS